MDGAHMESQFRLLRPSALSTPQASPIPQEGPGRGGRYIPRGVWAEGRQPPVRGLRLRDMRTYALSRCPQEPLLSRLGMRETQPQERGRMSGGPGPALRPQWPLLPWGQDRGAPGGASRRSHVARTARDQGSPRNIDAALQPRRLGSEIQCLLGLFHKGLYGVWKFKRCGA